MPRYPLDTQGTIRYGCGIDNDNADDLSKTQCCDAQVIVTQAQHRHGNHKGTYSCHCTACQLCVSACPNNVLRPSTRLDSLMQPVMSFERGYCRPECTRCSLVCPTGAIKPVTPEDKTAIHAGHAVWIKENCLPVKGGVHCGNCARHCPTGAIQMINYEGKEIPSIDTTKCIGCGACENLCPARPFSAIYVEGNEVHHIR